MNINIETNRANKKSQIDFEYKNNDESYVNVENISFTLKISENCKISVSGRIIDIRGKGKIFFADIYDLTGTIQIYISYNQEDYFQKFKSLVDTGDYIRVFGLLKKNNQNKLIIEIDFFNIVAKSLFILPKKISQKNLKQRYRYIDTVINSETAKIVKNQSKITKAIREILWEHSFSEYMTPTLSTSYNGGAARPFETTIRSLGAKGYLRVTSEIYLKSLIASGERKVFEICPQFRNEGLDSVHLPEFLMLEAYQSEATSNDMLKIALEIFEKIAIAINGAAYLHTSGQEIKCGVNDWEFINAYEFLLNEKDVDILENENYLRAKLEYFGIEAGQESSYATLVAKFINSFLLANIEKPSIITGLPHGLTPLMKSHSVDKRFADRYWLFINTVDFCDIGSEQADYEDQRQALYTQFEELNAKKAHAKINEDILNVLAFGIPPIAGIGMSLSRIAMIFANVQDIREASAFYFQ